MVRCKWGKDWTQQCYRVNIQLTLQIVAQHAARIVCRPYITWLKPVQCRPCKWGYVLDPDGLLAIHYMAHI
jgi:hypothetical protein